MLLINQSAAWASKPITNMLMMSIQLRREWPNKQVPSKFIEKNRVTKPRK